MLAATPQFRAFFFSPETKDSATAMAPSSFELKLKISSAKDLKNVNWRHGSLNPSVLAWVEPNAKSSSKVDRDGDTSPSWNETLHIPVNSSIDDSALHLEILHDKSDGEDDTKPLVGSACLSLRDVVDDVGFGGEAFRTLELRRPSGRPQGKIDVEISVKDSLHHASDRYYACAAPYAAPYIFQPFSQTPAVYGAAPAAGDIGRQSVYSFQVPTNHGQQSSYMHIMAAADEFGAGAETVLDVGAIAGALEGIKIAPGSLRSCPLVAKIPTKMAKRNEDEEED